MIQQINQLVREIQSSMPVICITNQFKRFDPLNLFRKFSAIAGSAGSRLDPRLQLLNPVYFAKHRSSALSNPALKRYLRDKQIDQLLVTGLYAEGCLWATIRDALSMGLGVSVLTDCIAARSKRKKDHMLEKYTSLGVTLIDSSSSDARSYLLTQPPVP